MLPQDVRVLRGPHILIRSLQLSRRRLPKDTAQKPVPRPDLRGHRGRAGGGHSTTRDAHVRHGLALAQHRKHTNLTSIA